MIYGNVKVGKVYEEEINPMMEEIYLRLLKDAKSHNKESVLYKHHIAYVKKMTGYYSDVDYEENTPDDIVVDYIASMTDDYFIDLHHYLFPNSPYKVVYKGYFDGREAPAHV